MQTQQEYPRSQARCLYFDANGNRVPQPCQHAAPAYDPWRALMELEKQSNLTR
jgi:hypothetical protein